MQELFFNGWTDDGISEFCDNHVSDNYSENRQNEDENGGYYLKCQNGDSFEIRYCFPGNVTSIIVVWINNELAWLVVVE